MRTISMYLLFGTFLLACGSPERKEPDDQKVRKVTVVSTTLMEYKIPVKASGILKTSSEMKLSFKTGGIIESVSVREGVTVRKGDELAKLDLAEINASVEQAKIGEEKAQRDLQRAQNLYRDSVATLEQFQDAQSAYDLARTRRRIADFNLLHSSIIAPSNGKIQKVLIEKNELIAPGYPAILFASTASEWVVRVAVIDKDIVRLNIGDTAHVEMDAFPSTIFVGEVTELASVADPVSGTYDVEVMLPGEHPRFRTGFISHVEILPLHSLQSLVVPLGTLLNISDRYAELFLYQDGKAAKRKVRIGSMLGDKVVVLEGLIGGEKVINHGARYLNDGDMVELVEEI